jgi:hypothetical protein
MRFFSASANSFCHSCWTSLMVALASFITACAEAADGRTDRHADAAMAASSERRRIMINSPLF